MKKEDKPDEKFFLIQNEIVNSIYLLAKVGLTPEMIGLHLNKPLLIAMWIKRGERAYKRCMKREGEVIYTDLDSMSAENRFCYDMYMAYSKGCAELNIASLGGIIKNAEKGNLKAAEILHGISEKNSIISEKSDLKDIGSGAPISNEQVLEQKQMIFKMFTASGYDDIVDD